MVETPARRGAVEVIVYIDVIVPRVDRGRIEDGDVATFDASRVSLIIGRPPLNGVNTIDPLSRIQVEVRASRARVVVIGEQGRNV